jgi:hypothetical protein
VLPDVARYLSREAPDVNGLNGLFYRLLCYCSIVVEAGPDSAATNS